MLVTKIKERKARIGVIGLGYVGLPLLIEFGKSGFPVTGLDIDTKKIESNISKNKTPNNIGLRIY